MFPLTARETENFMLQRCALAARHGLDAPLTQQDANVFRVAAMVLQSRLPRESAQLMRLSNDYFSSHPQALLPAVENVRRGWVVSLPRLRDMLSQQLLNA
jgi:hypothetical protein